MDAASTTPTDMRVISVMRRIEKKNWANSASIYKEGVEAKKILDASRVSVAKVLGVQSREVVFTGSGTEANNIAIGGYLKKLALSKVSFSDIHIITSVIEHSSILEMIRHFESMGVHVTYAPVSKEGIVDINFIEKNIKPNTVLISVMLANNEIGTIQPIRDIGIAVKKERARRENSKEKLPIVLHTDASQAPVYVNVTLESYRADMMTLDGHKMYGPKGVGALVLKSWVELSPIAYGGGQERNLRSGTEDVSKIAGFACALEFATKNREAVSKKVSEVQKYLFKEIAKYLPQAIVNGSEKYRLPNNINISIKDIDPEFTVLKLDKEGVSISTKSSCLQGEDESYVVKALGGEDWRAKNTLRFSFLKDVSIKDAHRIVVSLIKIFQS
jgi:cysteine desulfurase